jgi:Carboxypeptidase regulatory-like domain
MVGALLLLLVAEGQPAAFFSGRVTEQGSGQPLPRMVVTLVAPDRSQKEAITDADGTYRFAGLPPGKYAVGAGPDEHRSTYLRQWFGEAMPAAPFAGPQRAALELKAGEGRAGVDIALTRALAIEGRVSNPWDEPMANIDVTVTRSDGLGEAGRPGYTDDQGAYRIYGLAPGRYRVCASVKEQSDSVAPDGSRLVKTCYPAAVRDATGADVTVTSQDASGIDIRVQRAGSYSISGFVSDAAGRAVDNAEILALPFNESDSSSYARSRAGAFVLQRLTPGRYMIQASVGGALRGDPTVSAPDSETAFAPVEVSAGDTTGVSLTLAKTASLAGRIVFDGDPAPRGDRLRMTVHVQPDAEALRFIGRPPVAAVSDDLTFQLGGLYRLPVVIRTQGLPEGWVVRSVRYDGRDITLVPTDFTSAEARGPLEITLTNRVARPSVRVTDDQGAPMTGYAVVTVPADRSRWRHGLAVIPGTPSADGVLKMGTLPPGDYVLAALPAAELGLIFRDLDRVSALAAIGTRVTLDVNDTRTIELRLTSLPDKR